MLSVSPLSERIDPIYGYRLFAASFVVYANDAQCKQRFSHYTSTTLDPVRDEDCLPGLHKVLFIAVGVLSLKQMGDPGNQTDPFVFSSVTSSRLTTTIFRRIPNTFENLLKVFRVFFTILNLPVPVSSEIISVGVWNVILRPGFSCAIVQLTLASVVLSTHKQALLAALSRKLGFTSTEFEPTTSGLDHQRS